MIDKDQLERTIEQQIKSVITDYVAETIQQPTWQTHLKTIISQVVNRMTGEMMSSTDNSEVVSKVIHESLSLNQDVLKKTFPGVHDLSKGDQELTILNNTVVVENELVARTMRAVENIEAKSVKVSDLSVTGSINIDNVSWQTLADSVSEKTFDKIGERFVTDTVDKVLETASKSGIEFDNIRLGNQLLVDANRLSDRITDTRIEQTGTLNTLKVSKNADFFDTLHVVSDRIGVNTDTPDMALNVWDEEVSLSIGKLSSGRAFIGSTRKNEIALGVNRQGDIVIDTDGTTTINKLRVGRNAISHADQVPGWSGTKGDFVINTSPGKDDIFAWVCLGDYRWKTLKSA